MFVSIDESNQNFPTRTIPAATTPIQSGPSHRRDEAR